VVIPRSDHEDAFLASFHTGSVAVSIELIDAAENANFFRSLLSADELNRAARFRFDKDRHTFVACRGMLRCCLSDLLQVSPQDVSFAYSEEGKPHLHATRSEMAIEFNLSHTDGFAALAFAPGKRVGIDVEKLRDLADLLLIAEHHFSTDEFRRLESLPEVQRTLAFFRCWTRKEAYLKAVGCGISDMLAKVDVGFLDHESPFVHDFTMQNLASPFVVQPLGLPKDFIGALAIEDANPSTPHIHFSSIEDFLMRASKAPPEL
jgi:4'-phosphopantetheinyl transferase